jgi:hypothetical protein
VFERIHIGCGGDLSFVENAWACDVYSCSKCRRLVKIIGCPSFFQYHPELDPTARVGVRS